MIGRGDSRRGHGRPLSAHRPDALEAGEAAGLNIAAVLEGREAEPFEYKALGVLAGLGRRSAVAEILGFKFSGFVAWWLWRTIYLMKLPGFDRQIAGGDRLDPRPVFPADIVYLRPLHASRRRAPAHPRSSAEQDSEDPRMTGSAPVTGN